MRYAITPATPATPNADVVDTGRGIPGVNEFNTRTSRSRESGCAAFQGHAACLPRVGRHTHTHTRVEGVLAINVAWCVVWCCVVGCGLCSVVWCAEGRNSNHKLWDENDEGTDLLTERNT
ncbi:hypothetical protein E2C01_038276 [Portunus trituberculatus]|uniref:Uncharacterized protein n=1 Tax=Portunus trituberculatus TaxID=210409 RepID=A0A5B7FH55_PORTR|nr:hypothetical protein [Portunus trituberculatus]